MHINMWVTEVMHVAALEAEIHTHADQSVTREKKDNNPLHGNLAKALLTCQVL